MDELRKLRVAQDEDEMIEAGDEENLIDEQIFSKVNSTYLSKIKDDKDGNKAKSMKAHNEALYTSFNDIFNKMIPIGLKENNLAWMSKNQAYHQEVKSQNTFTENDLKKILKRVTEKLKDMITIPEKCKQKLISKPKSNDDDSEPSPDKEAKKKKKIVEENL